MSSMIHWLDESRTIVLNIYEGRWEWDDAIACLQQSEALLNEVTHKVAIIADFSATTGVPRLNMTLMQKLDNHPLMNHPNMTDIYVTGTRVQVTMRHDIFNRLMPKVFKRFHTVATLEADIQLINTNVT